MKRDTSILLSLGMMLIGVDWAMGVTLYTNDPPPPTPLVAELPLQQTIQQHGITWIFSDPVRVGTFVNGDFYVVGSVSIVAIDPNPENGRNGSVLNLPAEDGRSGFDNRVEGNRFDPDLWVSLPVQMHPGDSIISSISVDTIGSTKRVLRPEEFTLSPIRSVSVLTCMDAPQPPDAFRPAYCDTNNHVFLSRNLQRHLLPTLSPVPATPSLAEFEGYFQRPWIDTLFFNWDAPIDYMPDYSREIGRAVGMAGLLLALDFTPQQKESLLVYFVQYGIDLHGIVQGGHRGWPAFGGHGSGRKWPLLFAGILLNDPDMKQPTVMFGEDMQTMYGQGWTGATALYAGHLGAGGQGAEGPYEHLQPASWPGTLGENYRRCCTSICWVGQALGAHLLKAESIWNHPPFFDYVDRWMTEDDSAHVDSIQQQIGVDYHSTWLRQGQAWDAFVNQMWTTFRLQTEDTMSPAAPTNLRVVSETN